MNFSVLKLAVAKQFERLQKHSPFRVNVDKDELWETYLSSFPAGSNELYRERTEHDCSCCKQFIRAVGNVVAIINGKVESIWDVKVPAEPGYQVVADALSALVKSKPIADVFLHFEAHAGQDKNFEQLTTGVKTWEHFHVNIKREFVMKGSDIPAALHGPRTAKETFLRALTEIDQESIDTVQELIAQNSLYRGADHKFAVGEFAKLKREFAKLTNDVDRELYAWTRSKSAAGSVTGIRNTSIGTLLVDLAKGEDLEKAVKSFEVMVAPANYKRPTALVTKSMIESAKKKVDELGLTSALQRRYANLGDITINNLLFANSTTKQVLSGDPFDELASATSQKVKKLDKIEEISIAKFLSDVLPGAKSVEILVENKHAANFVSLIAPVDPTAGQLFKWPNNFSWSYSGEFADSIKERVKAAGGNVTGDLCCRLAWDYTDDLDFHMKEPGGGHIYFSNRGRKSPNGGMLDVDANGMDGIRENPVENIFYETRNRMREGVYTLEVNNYNRRSGGAGFEVEIEVDGVRHNFVYDKVLGSAKTIAVAEITYARGQFDVKPLIPSTTASKTVWNVPTQSFHQVNAILFSPNFWDEKTVGNQHFFFIVDGAKNDGTARGFFNEFLKDELTPHRKVMEIVGGKMKVPDSDDQLSGLGFSSTQRAEVVVKVTGAFTRTLKVTI
jgi:hypothetical protein